MKKDQSYQSLAKYYDLIYSWKNYEKESNAVMALIEKYKKSDGNDLLDVACGSGKHLEYFQKNFNCMGVDLNAEILKEAKKRLKNVPLKQADMMKLHLGKKFDVITCLFSAIAHVNTYPNFKRTIQGFEKHLKRGGVMIIEPFISPALYTVGKPGLTVYESDDIKIARMHVAERKGIISIMNMHFLIAEKGKKVQHFVDRIETALFEPARMVKIMEEAGLKTVFLKDGLMPSRGLLIGVKNI